MANKKPRAPKVSNKDTNVEFSDAPKKTKSRKMSAAIVDRNDELADALEKAKAEAEARVASGQETTEPKWVPADEPEAVADKSASAATQVKPSDLAIKYAKQNEYLLGRQNSEAKVEQPKKEDPFKGVTTGMVVGMLPGGGTVRRVQTPAELRGTSFVGTRAQAQEIMSSYKKYFPERVGSESGPDETVEDVPYMYNPDIRRHNSDGLPIDKYGQVDLNFARREISKKENEISRQTSIKEQYKKYFPERKIYQNHNSEGFPVDSSGNPDYDFASSEIEKERDKRQAEINKRDRVDSSEKIPSEAPESKKTTPSSSTIKPNKSPIDWEAREAARKIELLKTVPVLGHIPEIDKATGAVKLTPIKEYVEYGADGSKGFTRDTSDAKIFGPHENNISVDSYEPVGEGVVVPSDRVGWHQRAFVKKTTTYRRTNAGAGFDLIPEVRQHEGLFYQHPETNRWIQTFAPTTTRQALDEESNRQRLQSNLNSLASWNTKSLSDLEGVDNINHPIYSLLHDAIDKHHETLFSTYHGIGEEGVTLNKSGELVDSIVKKHTKETIERQANFAQKNPNISKLWVANSMQHFFSVIGENHPLVKQITDKILQNPDHIKAFFSANKVLLGSNKEELQAKAYKNAVASGELPDRVVPERYDPDAPMKNAVSALDRAPGSFKALMARRRAGFPPTAEARARQARRDAMDLGSTEGKQ